MTRKPKTIREAITYLYGALDIASRPASWLAASLQVIEVESEKLLGERDRAERWKRCAKAWDECDYFGIAGTDDERIKARAALDAAIGELRKHGDIPPLPHAEK